MKTNILLLSAISTLLLAGCSSSQKKYDGKDLTLTSSGESERPFWTLDGGYKIEKLREHFKDDKKNPQNAYFISQASVAKADLIPNCYNMARTRASSEISLQVSETVKEVGSMEVSTTNTEFRKIIETQSNNMIVGAQMLDKAWFKVDGEEKNPYKCFVALAIPRKNLDKLQQTMLNYVETKMSGDQEAMKRVKDSVEKRIQESF